MSKRYVNYDFYENGIEESVDGEKVNQIIEEIIEIMRKNKITVGTARTILEDTISSITKLWLLIHQRRKALQHSRHHRQQIL